MTQTSIRKRAKYVRRQHVRDDGRTPKVPHDDQLSAQQQADELAARRGERYAVYRCPVCPKWHVGRETTRQIDGGACFDVSMDVEIGTRANRHVTRENLPSRAKRLAYFDVLARTLVRVRKRDHGVAP